MIQIIIITILYILINAFLWFRTSQLISSLCGYHTLKDFLLLVKESLLSIKNGEPPSFTGHTPESRRFNMCLAADILFTLVHLFMLTSVLSWTILGDGNAAHAMKYISNIWIGIFIYTMFFWAIAEIATFVRWLVLVYLPDKKPGMFRKKFNPQGVVDFASKKLASIFKQDGTTRKLLALLRTAFNVTPEGHRRFMLLKTGFVIFCVLVISLCGVIHAGGITFKSYTIQTNKMSVNPNLKVALISDLHLGYSVGNEHLQKVVDLINEQDVDLVCIAGDIIDNDYSAIKNPKEVTKTLSQIKSKNGVYAVYGNHDTQEKLVGGFSLYKQDKNEIPVELKKMLKSAGIITLEDQSKLVCKDIQLVGRIDAEKPDGNKERKTINQLTNKLNQEKLIMILGHEPDQFGPKVVSGVDIDLAGHTHNGQIFPGNLIVNRLWSNAYGHKSIGEFHSIVSSGAGVWGPAMRIASNNEVVIINIKFSGEKDAKSKKK